jgi:transglutaminase-like putative cysteine protease
MRLRIAHTTVRRYDPPTAGVIQVLRLTPRNHEGQSVIRWRIDVSADVRLAAHEDAFGNSTHVFTADGPFDMLSVDVDGEVETENTNGVVRGAVERFPPPLFLRDTALTAADAAIRAFAQECRAANAGNTLRELHALLDRLYETMTHSREPSPQAANAAETYARKRGTAADFAHVFIGAAHSLAVPARYVAGCLCADGTLGPDGAHAWAEAFVPDLGWIGFDAANGMCPSGAYVRVAIGLDALGAAPVRGTRYGPGEETLAVAIKVDQ